MQEQVHDQVTMRRSLSPRLAMGPGRWRLQVDPTARCHRVQGELLSQEAFFCPDNTPCKRTKVLATLCSVAPQFFPLLANTRFGRTRSRSGEGGLFHQHPEKFTANSYHQGGCVLFSEGGRGLRQPSGNWAQQQTWDLDLYCDGYPYQPGRHTPCGVQMQVDLSLPLTADENRCRHREALRRRARGSIHLTPRISSPSGRTARPR